MKATAQHQQQVEAWNVRAARHRRTVMRRGFRRPLAFYIHEHNPALQRSSSIWFTRARWFFAGIVFACVLFVMWSV